MAAICRVKVTGQTSRFTIGADIDRITDSTMKASAYDVEQAAFKR